MGKTKGLPATAMTSTGLHIVALAALGLLARAQLVPILSLVAGSILLLRAVYGLSRFHRPVRPRGIGIQEIVFGLITVALAAAGYRWFG